jgi:cobalt-zinc-cadmium efflux system outer membrane protein
LAASIGVPQMAIVRVRSDIVAPLPDFQYEALRQGVLSRNALAEIARVEIARNRILLDRARVEPIPNLIAMGGYQYQLSPTVHSQALWQVTMDVPLFDRNQGNIRSAQANIGVASQQLQRVQNELSSQVAMALGNYLQAQQRVIRYEQQILPRARQIQQMAAQAYAQGEFDFLRLLQTQRTYLETNLAYVNAQEERWTAAATIAGLLQVEPFR